MPVRLGAWRQRSSTRAFIRVAGPDAEAYLQGQLSQDVATGGGLSWLLDPTGKAVAFLRFTRDGDGFLLDTDPQAADDGGRPAAPVPAPHQGDGRAGRRPAPRAGVRSAGRSPQAQPVAAWPPGDGVQDVIAPDPVAVLAVARGRARSSRPSTSGGGSWPACRSPASTSTADTIPAEAGRWTIESGVSFTKGCYTGQELVARIDSRGGNVPRPLRVLRFDAPSRRAARSLTPAAWSSVT